MTLFHSFRNHLAVIYFRRFTLPNILHHCCCCSFQQSAESRADGLDASCTRLKGQNDDLTRQLNEANALKSRLTQENFDLQHQVQELDSANASLAKAKNSLQVQLDDYKRQLDDETRVRKPYVVTRIDNKAI